MRLEILLEPRLTRLQFLAGFPVAVAGGQEQLPDFGRLGLASNWNQPRSGSAKWLAAFYGVSSSTPRCRQYDTATSKMRRLAETNPAFAKLKGKPAVPRPEHLRGNLGPVPNCVPVDLRNVGSTLRKRPCLEQSTFESAGCQIRRSVARLSCRKIRRRFKTWQTLVEFPPVWSEFYSATTSKRNRTRKVQC